MSLPQTKQEIRLQGIGVSPGIGFGPVEIFGNVLEEPEHAKVREDEVEDEMKRLKAALLSTRSQIQDLQNEIAASSDEDYIGIFEAHLLLLDDSAVIDEVIRITKTDLVSISWAYSKVVNRYIEILKKTSDSYLRERAVDIQDVAQRVLKNLRWPDGKWQNNSLTYDNCIILAHDLTPSETVGLDRSNVQGFATEAGSATSHSAIMARSLNIPAVVALHRFPECCSPGDSVLIDGYHGLVILNPSPETQGEYKTLSQQEEELSRELQGFTESETVTADGRKIILSANIEFTEELDEVAAHGAEGVGLYRTEFFYLNDKEMRSEERQADIYSLVARSTKPHGVIIRTVDVGGDKLCPELYDEPEPNPFLGWRGIRISLDRKDEFKAQLRAVLRASAHGKVRLMYPFISQVEEVIQANQILDECKKELIAEGIEFDEDIEVGVMIEIPSAVLIADHLAKEVDFFSIGTNDLIQYTTAVDRVNDRVAHLYAPTHPSVISLIRTTVEAAHRNGIWCGVCGEAASELVMAPIWVGLKVDELSVGAAQILRTRRAISKLDTSACQDLIEKVLETGSADDIKRICSEMIEAAYPEMLL